MLKEGNNNGGGSSNNWSRACDTCCSAACIVYCRADSAYLCAGWDARIHAANRVASRHERVPILPITGCLLGENDHGFIDMRDVSLKLMYSGYEVEEEKKEVVDEEEDEAEAASWLLPGF